MNQNPGKHHYLPITYIKHFTNKTGKVWVVGNNRNYPKQFHPRQICYLDDFYKQEKNGPFIFSSIDDPYYIEKNAFKNAENNYSKIINKLSLKNNDYTVLEIAEFIDLISIIFQFKRRNPNYKFILDNEYYKILKSSEFNIIKKIGEFGSLSLGQNPYPYLKKLNSHEYQKSGSKNLFLQLLLEECTSEKKVIYDFLNYKTAILNAPKNIDFITSDNPGFLLHGDIISSFGNFNSDFNFCFPINSKQCLYVIPNKINNQYEHKIIINIAVDESVVRNINKNQFKIKNSIAISSCKENLIIK